MTIRLPLICKVPEKNAIIVDKTPYQSQVLTYIMHSSVFTMYPSSSVLTVIETGGDLNAYDYVWGNRALVYRIVLYRESGMWKYHSEIVLNEVL